MLRGLQTVNPEGLPSTRAGPEFRATWKQLIIAGNSQACSGADEADQVIWLDLRPVSLSVLPSVTPFSPCSHHRIIMKFSGVITMVRSDVHAKGQGQRSKVKVTEVNTQLSRFRTLTPVWIHIWQWNHAHSWKLHRRGALLFFKVICQISRSHGSKNRRLWPRLGVSGLQLQFKFTNGYKMMHKAWSSIKELPYCFSRSYIKLQGHTAKKNHRFWPKLGGSGL